MHVHTYVHMHVHTYVHMHVHTYVHMHLHTYVHMCMHMYVHVEFLNTYICARMTWGQSYDLQLHTTPTL
jgi:hypothetical protein